MTQDAGHFYFPPYEREQHMNHCEKFTVYIRWTTKGNSVGTGEWSVPFVVEAVDHDAAAAKRLDMLIEPGCYDALLVVGRSEAHEYEIVSTAVHTKRVR